VQGANLLKTAVVTSHLGYVQQVLKHENSEKKMNLQMWGYPFFAQKSPVYLAVYNNHFN
jgi:hypothetical protein